MDFTSILTLQILVFAAGLALLVFLTRKIVELAWKKAGENRWWRELFLPFFPPLLGASLAAALSQYPFPEMFTNLSGRIFLGAVCGLASGTVYRVLKKFLADKSGETPTDLPN